MPTLKQALKNKIELEKFIKEHEEDNQGSIEKTNKIISSMILQKKTSTHQTSLEDSDGNCSDTQTL